MIIRFPKNTQPTSLADCEHCGEQVHDIIALREVKLNDGIQLTWYMRCQICNRMKIEYSPLHLLDKPMFATSS